MDIIAYISELLEHDSELVVPGLGAFYRSPVEGYYSTELEQFYPPSLQLLFDAEQQEDDGKLVNLLAAANRLNAEAAKSGIDKMVTDILLRATRGSVPFGDLGVFSMRRNRLVFTARKLSNNNELYYGLVPVSLNVIKKQHADETEVIEETAVITDAPAAPPAPVTPDIPKTEPVAPVAVNTVPAAINFEPVVVQKPQDVEEYDEDSPEAKAKRVNWVLMAAIVLLLIGIGLVAAYEVKPVWFKSPAGVNTPPPAVVTARSEKKHLVDSLNNSIQAQRDIGAAPVVDSTMLKKVEDTPVPVRARVDTFGIVIATFENYTGAARENGRYLNHGYSFDIRRMPNDSRFQINVATYLQRDSAMRQLPLLKKKFKEDDLYIQRYPDQRQ